MPGFIDENTPSPAASPVENITGAGVAVAISDLTIRNQFSHSSKFECPGRVIGNHMRSFSQTIALADEQTTSQKELLNGFFQGSTSG